MASWLRGNEIYLALDANISIGCRNIHVSSVRGITCNHIQCVGAMRRKGHVTWTAT